MRILAVSDIHGNVRVTRRLRAQETEAFDLVIAAGDLGFAGGKHADEVLAILASFGCPVLYVLGNHDAEIAYDRDFGPACIHLHHRVFEANGVAFLGYSGLPAHWGLNPEVAELEATLARRHGAVNVCSAELEEAERFEVARIDGEAADSLKHLHAEVGDRRAKAYRDGAAVIEASRLRRVHDAGEPLRQLRSTEAWLHKDWDAEHFDAFAIRANRAFVSQAAYALDPRRCVVVTHERQADTDVDMPYVPLFLFGHAHGYRDKTWKDLRFVNVSALDGVASGPFGAGPAAQARMGTYAVIEIGYDDVVSTCRKLDLSADRKSPFYGGTP